MCQDYMHSITRELDPEALRHARVKLIIISNGDPAMINPYLRAYSTLPPKSLLTQSIQRSAKLLFNCTPIHL